MHAECVLSEHSFALFFSLLFDLVGLFPVALHASELCIVLLSVAQLGDGALGVLGTIVLAILLDELADSFVARDVLGTAVHRVVPFEVAEVARDVVNVRELFVLSRERDLFGQHLTHVVLRGMEVQKFGNSPSGMIC